jgi:hypothetical protein
VSTFAILVLHDGEAPDEMNTRLIGPLPGNPEDDPDFSGYRVIKITATSVSDWLAGQAEWDDGALLT